MCLNITMVATPLPSNTPMINISYQLKYSRFTVTRGRSFNRQSLASLNQQLKGSWVTVEVAGELPERARSVIYAKA